MSRGRLNFSFVLFLLTFTLTCFAQEKADLEFTLDTNSETIPLPKIFRPNIDLSGRGFHREVIWPQTLAAGKVLDTWQKEIGLSGLYRMQYSLWEINELSKDKELQNTLLANYENIIKRITDAGGIVILDIFGTPAGMGKVLDKRSAPRNIRVFKRRVKNMIRDLSCRKRYNIWYELWNAPDLDDFFLGRKQEYFNLYRAVAESISELKEETKIHIPFGGPSVSWWFQNLNGNTIITPERSLIYELIKFCARYRLPLDFITWHGFSTSPKVEKEITRYKKTAVTLIRDWLSYFNFDRNTLLIVDEWNYDRNANVLLERKEKSFICASYIPCRIENMYEAGIDYQLYFCLEDFQNNKEQVVRNVGAFFFDAEASKYKGGPKSVYNVFKMLANLGSDKFLDTVNDEFVGVIATKSQEGLALLVYNYIDPDIATNYLSQNIASLSGGERKFVLNIIKSDKLEVVLGRQSDISALRTTKRVKGLLEQAKWFSELAAKFKEGQRKIKININNLGGNYLYQRYTVDSSCRINCKFAPVEKKDLDSIQAHQELLTLEPYSVHFITLEQKPPEIIEEAKEEDE